MASITIRTRTLASIGIILLIVALSVGGWFGYRYYQDYRRNQLEAERVKAMGLSDAKVTEADKKQFTVSTDKPRFISIPAIGVNQARVQEIGLMKPAEDGSQQMDSPKNVHDVGWYNCQINPIVANRCTNFVSPTGLPNDRAAIIDGHSCETMRLNCVFDKLTSVKHGDSIVIELGNGDKVTYLIDKVETINLANVDMNQVMKPYQQDTSGLNLITCDGRWTARDQYGAPTMDKRVVVYSTKV